MHLYTMGLFALLNPRENRDTAELYYWWLNGFDLAPCLLEYQEEKFYFIRLFLLNNELLRERILTLIDKHTPTTSSGKCQRRTLYQITLGQTDENAITWPSATRGFVLLRPKPSLENLKKPNIPA